MASAAPLLTPPRPVIARAPIQAPRPEPPLRFAGLSTVGSLADQRRKTLTISLTVHAVLIAALMVLPLLGSDMLPAPAAGVRAFFVSPAEAPPPPPPPPPAPAAGLRRPVKAAVLPSPPDPSRFVAPIQVPDRVAPEETIDLGIEGGVPGGVEGGVPGGVVGGVVGGLPSTPAAPPAPRIVRVGGAIVAPKLVNLVQPEYPQLARASRLQAAVVLEAHVDTNGYVTGVNVIQGVPLLDAAAVAAVKQWRYRPLLLNGMPTEFLVTVTVRFSLSQG